MKRRYVEADLYKVEKIIDHRCKKKGKEVLVNWEGYGSEDNSWEPEKDIRKFADFRVQQYYDKLKLIDLAMRILIEHIYNW
jgi:hypothetical protein